MQINNNVLKSMFLGIAIIFLLIVPDYIYSACVSTYKVTSFIRVIICLLLPISIGLLFNKYKCVSLIYLSVLAILQLMQFSCLSYFGRLLTQYDFGMISAEYEDIILGAGAALRDHWIVLPIVLVPFALIWVLLSKVKIKKHFIGTVFLFLITAGDVYVGLQKSMPYPVEGRLSISNTLKSFFLFVEYLFENYEPPEYKKYEIKNTWVSNTEPVTIVYVMGESVNLNHMSVFGYGRDTTPNLKTLVKSNNVYATEGIAGGVCTKASLRFMGNVIWEPDNIKINNGNDSSLFKMAKANGFKTFYLASDPRNMVNVVCNTSSKYIDVLKTKESDFSRAARLVDDYILELIDAQQFSGRDFIVLHQRCIHFPYPSTFPKAYENKHYFGGGKIKRVDEYDNAMRYNDTFIFNVFNRFNKQKRGKFYIIWAADHNELMGENGMFGHSILDPEVARIPILVQSNDEKFMKKFKTIFRPTHYEISKMIAEVLGFEIKNPNEQKNVFYIDGLDYNGRDGYIKVVKDPLRKTLKFEKRVR